MFFREVVMNISCVFHRDLTFPSERNTVLPIFCGNRTHLHHLNTLFVFRRDLQQCQKETHCKQQHMFRSYKATTISQRGHFFEIQDAPGVKICIHSTFRGWVARLKNFPDGCCTVVLFVGRWDWIGSPAEVR